jgi:hypothetical protein
MRGKPPFTYPRSLALARLFRESWRMGFVLALLATGCSHDHAFRDPLCGDNLPIPTKTTAPPPAAVATGSSTPEAKTKEPASSSTGLTNATLTMGAIPRPEQEHPPDASAPVLQPPVTKNVPANGSSHIVPISAMGVDTYEDFQNQLKNLGVTAQSLQKQPNSDQWRFYCTIPVPGGKGIQRSYDATESGANGLNAIRAALAKIKMNPP